MNSDLRNYIKCILQEVVVKIGNEDYDVPDDKAELLKTYISDTLKIKKFDPDEYLVGLENYPETAIEIQELLKNSYPQTVTIQNIVKKHLSGMYPAEIAATLSDRREAGGVVTVPEVLYDLAEFGTPGSAGSQIGRGELVIPLMFVDAKLATASNDPYDVTMSDQKWHVKEGKPSVGIRMGSAKGKSFSDTSIYQTLLSVGISPGTLFNIGAKDLSSLLVQALAALKTSNIKTAYSNSVDELYDEISRQATSAALGDAAGILWYGNGKFTFTSKDDLGLKYITQGRAVLSVDSKRQVLSYLDTNRGKERKSAKSKPLEKVEDEQ